MVLEEACKLEIFFLSFLAPGHIIPMLDMARLFAARGVKATMITTPLNALLCQKSIDHDIESGYPIGIHLIKFPGAEVGLPKGIENIEAATSEEMSKKFFEAFFLLQRPIEQIFRECRPNCIVSDIFYPWTADVATELGIPRILFYGMGFLSLCADNSIHCYGPHQNMLSDTEPFLLPGLPDMIKMTRSQLPWEFRFQTYYNDIVKRIRESIPKSYGVLVHSFYELESAYAEHYKKNIKEKVWHVGPVGLYNRDDAKVKAERGSKVSAGGYNHYLDWLNSQKPDSVLYICFGSSVFFTNAQLLEIASSLEASSHPFVWVVRKNEKSSSEEKEEEWLPQGFEKRMVNSKKGMIIRGWAPQQLILEHPAIGGFLTHAGWNSLLESVTAGVPMITWPLYGDQFYNEKLVVEVLKIGVAMGVEGPNSASEEEKMLVTRDKIENMMAQLMDGRDDAENIRKRVKELSAAAKRSMEEGGSSNASLTALIQEISLIKAT